MTIAWAPITLRLHRDVVAGAVLALTGALLVALLATVNLEGIATGSDCPGWVTDCIPHFEAREIGSIVLRILGAFPIFALILGVPLVARELERSTTELAWTLEPSRWRWYLQRLVPILVVALVGGVAAAMMADRLEASINRGIDPAASFLDYGFRGPVLVGRVLVALGCGVLVGSLLGRILPALVVASVACALLLAGIEGAHTSTLESEAAPTPEARLGENYAGLTFGYYFALPSGERLTYEELEARYPDPAEFDGAVQAATPTVLAVPPERYGEVAAREALVASTIGLGFLVLAGFVVGRRRPGSGMVRLVPPRIGGGAVARRFDRLADWLPPSIRILLWPHRLELAAGVAVGLGLSVAVVAVTAGLTAIAPPSWCLANPAEIPTDPACQTGDAFLLLTSDWGNRLFAAMSILPWLVGALIGVVIVGRELEERTAVLAWSLAPDRRLWLAPRLVVALVLVVLLLALPAYLMTELQRIGRPWVDPAATVDNYGLRGLPVIARAVAGFALGVAAGAITGRVLAGALLAAGLCIGAWLALSNLVPYGAAVEFARHRGVRGDPLPPGLLLEVELREGLVLAVVVVIALVLTTVLIDRRAPER